MVASTLPGHRLAACENPSARQSAHWPPRKSPRHSAVPYAAPGPAPAPNLPAAKPDAADAFDGSSDTSFWRLPANVLLGWYVRRTLELVGLQKKEKMFPTGTAPPPSPAVVGAGEDATARRRRGKRTSMVLVAKLAKR
uniref:Uncharacterized protein n=1 Tax=Zea mays TaxID=4577 RepID=A0A804QES1_MAIZE